MSAYSDKMEGLLAPISDELPCGGDLEYDAEFLSLETLATFRPERQVGDSILPAEPPDWREVYAAAEQLFQRTKDLRVAISWVRAATAQHGMEGLVDGLGLMAGLVERYWADVYPKLDADDDNDPTMRLNALAVIGDETGLRMDLLPVTLAISRGLGTLRVREALSSLDLFTRADSDQVYTAPQIEGAIHAALTESGERRNLAGEAAKLARDLEARVRQEANAYDALSLQPLLEWLDPIAEVYERVLASFVEVSAEAGEQIGGEPSSGGGAITGEVQSRDQAIRALEKVCAYLERAEPTNPAPLLIRRAQRLMTMSFLEIMRDLAPEALPPVHNIAGVRESEPED
jgi:type VI secretion system protein ImpA